MATPNPASECPSWEGTRNVPKLDCSVDGDHKYLDTFLNFSYINFSNICSLRSNFQSVEHHLSSTKPYLLFLTELSQAPDSCLFSVLSYILYLIFNPKLDVASMCTTN
ncbi:hypothetical protein E2C01_051507 [Portunus trituberculatus]|uniref:Uncharacterized protein n=1 Tax=Portunus trituberculatus TaxID=210409 RepID=A0A5B7GIW9_PORTR|nr:hypothetical protein [Portunus trituberculatus]